jgi:hypothetical protein
VDEYDVLASSGDSSEDNAAAEESKAATDDDEYTADCEETLRSRLDSEE